MYASHFSWGRDFTADDGLEALAPYAQSHPHAIPVGMPAIGPAVAAMAGVLVAVLVTLSGLAQPLVLALGGTAAFAYLGTAMISGRAWVAAFDLAAAAAAIGIALAAAGPAVSALLVHVMWGVLRGAWPGAAPGRKFAASWAALHGMAALLLGFST